MIQRLFIAEKPSLAKAIAEGLGENRRLATHYVCGQDAVTWCYGPLLEQCDPEDYDAEGKYWRRDTLPMIPSAWKLKPRLKAKEQLQAIEALLKEAESVVNAGDPDREGQLLVDEVLERFSYQGPVRRIWLASLDARSVSAALSSLKDNQEYANLRDAARARSQADWLVGLNATRALSIRGRESGREGILSLGRVQTPTLALVVTRDRQIAAFKPIDYLILQATLRHETGTFTATFAPMETQTGLDNEGRLVDPAVAQGIVEAVRGRDGLIVEMSREKKKKAVPLPHCLSSLQKAASSKLGMTAQQVLDTAQALYEKKLTTYPRTDCRYLPLEQFSDAGRILPALSGVPGLELVTAKADVSLKGPVWDTKKVTAHHAIIPTGEIPQGLSNEQTALYLMIATAYSLQFYTPMQYEAQKIRATIAETAWEARGRLVLDAGWTGFAAEEDEEDARKKEKEEQALPPVNKGDTVTCAHVETVKKKTSPPSRFSEGSLIEAMANVHHFVNEASAKATLKENEGIGTEATRANILETLKKRGFIAPSGKSLVSTPLGQEVIDLTPHALRDPVTTAQWEQRLEAIAQGKSTLDAFMKEQSAALPGLMSSILDAAPQLVPGAYPCPTCGKTMIRRNGKNAGEFFWACTDPGCRTFLPDADGKPGQRRTSTASEYPCPVCGKPLYARTSDKGAYWACFNKEGHPDGKPVFLPDEGGKPGQPKEKSPRVVTEFVCPDCGKSLLYRQGTSKAGKPYEMFSCSGYPQCRASFWGDDGKPDFTRRPK